MSQKLQKKTTAKKTAAKNKPKTTSSRKAKEPGPYEYSKQFLKEMQNMLLKMREELLEDVTRSVKEESNHLRFDVGDFYDHASEDRQRELALTLSNRERDKLMLIEPGAKKGRRGHLRYL